MSNTPWLSSHQLEQIQEAIAYYYVNRTIEIDKELICECGSDSVKSPMHAHYCPKSSPMSKASTESK